MRDMAQLRLQVGDFWLLSKPWQSDAPEMSEIGKGRGEISLPFSHSMQN